MFFLNQKDSFQIWFTNRKNKILTKLNKLDVKFFQGNWLNAINYEAIDLLISNPPYIQEADPCLQADGILFEP